MSILWPASVAAAKLSMLAAVLIAPLWVWSWWEARQWIVSRAVDRDACAGTSKRQLTPATPDGSRELFVADAACRKQIVGMLSRAPNFSCRTRTAVTICEHPLNAANSTTYVRAILRGSDVLLVTIPT